jgi:CBS domain containing-hemolysin-like protein
MANALLEVFLRGGDAMPLFPFTVSARFAVGNSRHQALFWEEVLTTLGFMLAITTALVVVFGTLPPARINLLSHASFVLLTVALFGMEVTTYRYLFPEPDLCLQNTSTRKVG